MRRSAPPHQNMGLKRLSHPATTYQAAALTRAGAARSDAEAKPRIVGNSVYGPEGPSTAFVSPLDGRAKR
jgi:hypothetical protein